MQLAVQLATPADDASIRRLLHRSPMPGRIGIVYEREPEFRLGCEVAGEDYQVLVARAEDQGEVIGVACRASRIVFVNGRETRLGYLGQLRVDARFRGRWLVSRGFSQLKALHDRDPLPGYLASIIDGNREAAGVLVRNRRRNFPGFQAVAQYHTLAIGIHRAKAPICTGIQIAAAHEVELPEIVRFLQANGSRRQFCDVWTEARLRRLFSFGLKIEDLRVARRDGQIVGIAGLWDQSEYKQSVVSGYSGWLKAAAPFHNLVAPLLGRAPLPRPGEMLKSAYVCLVSIARDELNVFRALLRELYNLARVRGLNYILVGLDTRDPLLPAALEVEHVDYVSGLYLAQWSEGGPILEQLDARPTYVEIATL
jgi:hypothetical protein